MEWINADFLLLQIQLMGRRHIGAMRLVATRMVPDGGRPPRDYILLPENVVTGARLLRSPVGPVLP